MDLRYDLGESDPLVGAHMIGFSLRTPHGATTVSALLQSGHEVLLELRDAAPRPTVVPERIDQVTELIIDWPVGSALGASPGVSWVLVRPDGPMCWSGVGWDLSRQAALRRWLGIAFSAA